MRTRIQKDEGIPSAVKGIRNTTQRRGELGDAEGRLGVVFRVVEDFVALQEKGISQ